ncbi:MAG: hypothetical protein ABI837_10815 [Acidobacteriota bacterium]
MSATEKRFIAGVMRALVAALLPHSHRESVLGDLEEEFGVRASREGSQKASWWYIREAARAVLVIGFHLLLKRSLFWIVLLAAAFGSAGLILLNAFDGSGRPVPGWLILDPWSAMFFSLTIYLRWKRITRAGLRFSVAMSSSALVIVASYLYAVGFKNPSALEIPLSGHLWRLAVGLGIAAAFSGLVVLGTSSTRRSAAAFAGLSVPWLIYSFLFLQHQAARSLRPITRVILPFGTSIPLGGPRGLHFDLWVGMPLNFLLWSAIAMVLVNFASRIFRSAPS